MSAEETIEGYYDALRAEEPLVPYFAEGETVKVGISERLVGFERVAEGLREQTETTSDWVVESRDLHVAERESVAWFADEVRMAWTTDEGERHDFETRWSGTLERREEGWRFVGMHVSVPREL
ncbi:nuclear transport factor 2 family protein [Halalkalicoccus sp. NIPERK01]|uniref:nuclear transport factor 2 family protein n=1 Tax=Halalkalicoccus sp. NIPERK01 TaxID=3053469 RepID=UPI00256EC89F|nr:nuclear transport factor 2 family protein [Halalkalicoccus sp. NIPERK01]MDL5361299.1 nuclear transport factor 2 family protein [Halalkalicoccus sp. NIPERK01]